MTRNVFLSFLGTGSYTECIYGREGERQCGSVEFVQTALSLICCSHFKDKDKALIFLTEGAKEKNWNKLKLEMEKKNPGFQLEPVMIPDGHSEAEIWDIFETVYKQLHSGDHVVLDVTHAFRSLPMLGIVMMNYSKFLKDITVKRIYYGAFDALGSTATVESLPINQRHVPILDLSAFDKLQHWSAGADSFVSSGDPTKITELLREWAHPKLAGSGGSDPIARIARDLARDLDRVYQQLSTVRGNKILEGKAFVNAYASAAKLSRMHNPIPALSPLLARLMEKLRGFEKGNIGNGVLATRLCLDFGLIQQGITLLQEHIITWIADKHPKLTYEDLGHRRIVSSAMHIHEGEIPEEHWDKSVCGDRQLVTAILEFEELPRLSTLYRNLTHLRNDINHGGHVEPRSPEKFARTLSEYLDKADLIMMQDNCDTRIR